MFHGAKAMKSVRKLFAGLALTGAVAMLATIDVNPAHAQAGKKAIEGKGTGTIKGKAILDGDVPAGAKVKMDQSNKDISHCMKGDTEDLTWVVGPNKGLANVVVYLKAPSGSYFKVDTSKKTWQDEVAIDQPYCAFKPHVSILFPEYEGKPTGQKLTIKNSSPILHNSRYAGSKIKNAGINYTIPAGKSETPNMKADNQPITLSCDAHKWMEAYVWAFDHPYAALTGEDGSFEIKNVPTGVDVQVMAWHESDGKSSPGKEVKKGALKDGDEIEIKVKKK
jgi:hypothetical protein